MLDSIHRIRIGIQGVNPIKKSPSDTYRRLYLAVSEPPEPGPPKLKVRWCSGPQNEQEKLRISFVAKYPFALNPHSHHVLKGSGGIPS